MERLAGRVAVVTGAAGGIGKALAELLAAGEMAVVMADLHADALSLAAKELEAGGADVLAVPTDVSDPTQVQELAAAAVERFGAVQVLCNNAGIAGRFGRTRAGSSEHALLGLSEALARELTAAGSNVAVTVMMPAGVAKTDIMASERNWLDRLGPLPDADNDPLPTMVRNGFTAAAVEAIKTKRYLVCDDLDLLAEWSSHHVSQGLGEAPKWPL